MQFIYVCRICNQDSYYHAKNIIINNLNYDFFIYVFTAYIYSNLNLNLVNFFD